MVWLWKKILIENYTSSSKLCIFRICFTWAWAVSSIEMKTKSLILKTPQRLNWFVYIKIFFSIFCDHHKFWGLFSAVNLRARQIRETKRKMDYSIQLSEQETKRTCNGNVCCSCERLVLKLKLVLNGRVDLLISSWMAPYFVIHLITRWR